MLRFRSAPVRRLAAPRRAAGLAALCAAAAAAACGDPLEAASRLNTQNFAFSVVLYPFRTAPTPLPTAISVGNVRATGVVGAVRPAVVADAATGILITNFDFVVDVTSDGRVQLVPSKLIAGLGTTGQALRAGVRVVDAPFDSLRSAPSGTYQNDSTSTVRVGQTVVLDVENVSCIQVGRPSIVAKIVVDSVSSATGGVYVRGVVDPNCGYRSLVPNEQPTS